MLAFSLIANFVESMGMFPNVDSPGASGIDETNDALGLTTLGDDATMWTIFIGVTGLTFIGAVALAFMTKSITPIGLHIFGAVFWASWINMLSILSYGGYIPGDFLIVFTVGVMFVFIAAIVGMLTGSG